MRLPLLVFAAILVLSLLGMLRAAAPPCIVLNDRLVLCVPGSYPPLRRLT